MPIPKYTKIPVDVITSPKEKDVVQILEDHWWVITPDEEVLLYRGHAPQCNRNPKIAELILKKHPGHTIRLLPFAFVPWKD